MRYKYADRNYFVASPRYGIGVLLSILFFFSSPTASAETLFGYVGFRTPSTFEALPRWKRVLQRIESEKVLFKACDDNVTMCFTSALTSWREFMDIQKQRQGSRLQKIKSVNSFVNRWPYITDQELWGLSDYWATPMEFLEHSGDCEDYAILKYVSLRELGIPAADMRLLIVKDVVRDIAHAILAVQVDGTWLILDSLFAAVLSEDKLLQYQPYYAVNEHARWTYIPPLNKLKQQ